MILSETFDWSASRRSLIGNAAQCVLWSGMRGAILLVLICAGLSSCSSVTVRGMVEKLGKVRWFRELTVRDAIAKAGGVTEFSGPLRVHVSRGYIGLMSTVQGHHKLQPDDVVSVIFRTTGQIKSWKAAD